MLDLSEFIVGRGRTRQFGSNIGGIILGGLSEFCSLIVGFNGLLAIAMGFYLLAVALRRR